MRAPGPEAPDGPTSSDAVAERPPARAARVTIRQVAELAGVSISTVSRVLNGRSDVSEETRLVVERVARSHGYDTRRALPADQARPSRERLDPAGEPLSGLVGVTTTTSGTAYFSTILTGITEALAERDMWALVSPTRQERDREVSALQRLMRSEMIGALLLLPEESPDELRRLQEDGLVFVVVDPLRDLGPDIAVVSAANSSGAYQATAHLLQLGHRRIGIITGRRDGAATRALHIDNAAGTNLSGSVAVPDTGGYETWTTVDATVTLPAGQQTLTVDQDSNGWNFHYLAFA